MDSAAEQSLSPKKKPSQTENGNKLKRKPGNDGDLQNVNAKSPKKEVVAATRVSRRNKDLKLVDEVVLDKPKGRRINKKSESIEGELVDEVVLDKPKGRSFNTKPKSIEGELVDEAVLDKPKGRRVNKKPESIEG